MLCFLRARSTLGALEGYCRPMCTKLAPGKSRANFFRTQRDLKKKKHPEGGEGHLGFTKKNFFTKGKTNTQLKGTCVKVGQIIG